MLIIMTNSLKFETKKSYFLISGHIACSIDTEQERDSVDALDAYFSFCTQMTLL